MERAAEPGGNSHGIPVVQAKQHVRYNLIAVVSNQTECITAKYCCQTAIVFQPWNRKTLSFLPMIRGDNAIIALFFYFMRPLKRKLCHDHRNDLIDNRSGDNGTGYDCCKRSIYDG